MSITTLLAISLGAILTNNFIFSQFLGICPFLGVSKKIDTAVGMGAAVTFVMGLASALCYPVNSRARSAGSGLYADRGLHSGHRRSGAVRGNVPEEEHPHPVYRPGRVPASDHHQLRRAGRCSAERAEQTTTSSRSVVYGITGGLGFLLAIFLFAAVREQLEVSSENPKAFDGFPIALVTAGLMALAFMGFSGLKVW